MSTIKIAILTAAGLVLSACAMDEPMSRQDKSMSQQGTSAAEEACRVAVAQETVSTQAVVLSSDPYQGGGRYVRVGIGPTQEVWQCIALADGSTTEIQYLSDGDATQRPTADAGKPAVGSEYDLTSFEGARAGQAENGIRALGYEPIRSRGLTTYWFNRSTGACAEITTSDGRYSSVTMLSAEDC